MSADRPLGQTPSQTVGPFFAFALTPVEAGHSWSAVANATMADDTTPGQRIVIEGRVLDGQGAPITDALIELWQADAAGRTVARAGANATFTGFGRSGTGMLDGGMYRFTTIKPGAAAGGAPHIEVILQMRGLLTHLFTRLYFDDEAAANARDAALTHVPAERRHTLTARTHAPGRYVFDIHMQGDDETVFFDL